MLILRNVLFVVVELYPDKIAHLTKLEGLSFSRGGYKIYLKKINPNEELLSSI